MRICDVCGARYKGTPIQCPLDGGRLRDLPDPLLGCTLGGRYVVLEKIGGGGMGTVYRGHDEASGADVAIKFLIPELANDSTHRRRFLREAKAANRIDHENIIEVTDFGETTDGQVYLVMEFLRGIVLDEEIGKGPLGVVRSVDIAMQCASALARAHELDVIHRDIKPENIYLVATPVRRDFVKILDFGLAHMKGDLRLTATGAVFGTPEYMAPEQARGASLTGLADLYALGCVLFEMLTGTPPFSGSTPDLVLKHMRETAPLPSSRAPGVPPDVDAIVRQLLEKDPRKRHRDAHHLFEDLRRVADRLSMGRPSTVPVSANTMPGVRPTGPARGRSMPADSTAPTLPQGWEQRVELFRQLVVRAYPEQPPPIWLVPAIEALPVRIARVRAIESELANATERAAEREASVRQLRLRIGRALDELGRDESRALRRIEELTASLGDLRRKLADREGPLASAIARIRELGTVVSAESARAVWEAGAIASAWLELDVKIKDVLRQLEDRERERDDLRFQISQLKGRLAAIAVEQDLELGAIRDRASELARDRENAVDDLHARAMTILAHFAEFPALEDAVKSARLDTHRGGAAAG